MKIIVDVDNFARTVEDICDAADMSCFNLCEKAGLGKNVAYPWLNGKARPQLYVFSRFAEAAGFRVVLEEVTE